MEAPDERAVVERASRGDAGACEALFRRWHGTVFRICRTYARTDEDAMDLAQDSFVKAFSGLSRLSDPQAFPAWMATIARNVGRDFATSQARSPEIAVEAPERADPFSAEDRVLRAEARRLAGALLGAMPDGRPRQVAELFYLKDQDVVEVAGALGVSVTNVTSSLARARGWLRAHLLAELGELRGYGS